MSAFYIYEDTRGEYRWRLRDNNQEIIAVSGEGYTTEYGAERAIKNVKIEAPKAPIYSLVNR